MKFLKLEAGLKFSIVDADQFDSSLRALQENVDGWVDIVSGLFRLPDDFDAWVNGEGLFRKDLDFSCAIASQGELVDAIRGPVIFTRRDSEGETLGLSDEDIEKIKKSIQGMPQKLVYQPASEMLTNIPIHEFL